MAYFRVWAGGWAGGEIGFGCGRNVLGGFFVFFSPAPEPPLSILSSAQPFPLSRLPRSALTSPLT